MRDINWQLRYYLSILLEGEGAGGSLRFMFILAVVSSFGMLGRLIEQSLVADDWLHLILSFASVQAVRHWIAPISGAILAVIAGIFYVQDIFEFENFSQAQRYFFASLFGMGYPRLIIDTNQKTISEEQTPNPLLTIGGPGILVIKQGSVVLLERGVGPTQVLSSGVYMIRRFETIRAILNLRETYREIPEVNAVTRDGLPLVIRNVEATFRLDTGRYQRSDMNPYPFAVGAVRNAVYSAFVDEKGQMADWPDVVMRMIAGEVSEWVERQKLDRLTAPIPKYDMLAPPVAAPGSFANPEPADPRAALRLHMNSKAVRRKLDAVGAELIWLNFGHFDTPADVDEPRLEQWRSKWLGQDKVNLAQGEALRVKYEDLGRTEGQVDIINAIAQALEPITPEDAAKPPVPLADLVLMRLSGVLEAMTAPPGLGEINQSPLISGERPTPADDDT